MPEDMSDRMPEDLPVTKRINVMAGITRSKVIVVFFPSLSHPAALDRQRQETTTKQRERPTAANIHQQHLPKEESKRKARAPTKDLKIPKSNQRRAGKGKGPGNLSLEKRDQKRDANEIRALAAANSRKVKSEG